MDNTEWTPREIEIAQLAFSAGTKNAEAELIRQVQEKSVNLTDIQSLFEMHDYLSIERYELEGRSRFDPDTALFAFAEMVKRGLMDVSALEGLEQKKISKIRAMSMF